jgi:hypothetical protein
MTDRVEVDARLVELRREFQAGEGQLRELVQREAALRETLLRISGAIQVLEELVTPAGGRDTPGTTPSHGDGADVARASG